jgi:hypothetical protein
MSYAPTAEQQRRCSTDDVRLRNPKTPDVDRVTICMRKHKASLSDGWQGRVRYAGTEFVNAVTAVGQRLSGNSLSCQCAFIATADAWLALHANGTTNTPSNANAANIAHASLTLNTKAAFSIIGRT